MSPRRTHSGGAPDCSCTWCREDRGEAVVIEVHPLNLKLGDRFTDEHYAFHGVTVATVVVRPNGHVHVNGALNFLPTGTLRVTR